MASIKIFYSWASDNSERECRNLIREALQTACEELTGELEEAGREVTLDHDTKGETGSPPITETIERKIRDCDVFVADLTPAAVQDRTDGSIRIIPNPNVMYELGYAYRSHDYTKIITVMNTGFAGSALKAPAKLRDDVLPFNLRHRSYPICYHLHEGAEKKDLRLERERLLKALVAKIKPLTEKVAVPMGPKHEPHAPIDHRGSTFLRDGDVILKGEFGQIVWRDKAEQLYVRFIPDVSASLTMLKVQDAVPQISIPPYSTSSGDFGKNSLGFVKCATRPLENDEIISRDMIQFFRSGEVWAICSSILRDKGKFTWLVEDIFAWAAACAAKFAEGVAYTGPGTFVFGIIGIEDWEFLYPSNGYQPKAPFHQSAFRYEHQVQICSHSSAHIAAETAASRLWEEVGLERPKEYSDPIRRAQIGIRPGYWALFDDA